MRCSLRIYVASLLCAIVGSALPLFVSNPIESPLLIVASLLLPMSHVGYNKSGSKKLKRGGRL